MDKKPMVSIVQNDTTADAKRIDEMLKESIDLIGGIGKFVKEGQTVVIKANFFAPAPPPVIVDRRVLAALLKLINTAKPAKVTVAEGVSIGTKLGRNSTTAKIAEEMGIIDVVKEAGAEFLCLEDDERVTVEVPNAMAMYKMAYPKTILEADVLIDLPCMKTHGITMVTLGLKNYQGLLNDVEKYYCHRDDLPQKLIDIHKVKKTDLTVIDGLLAMEGNGAGEAGIPKPMNVIIAGDNVVSADAVASACMGIDDPLDVTTTRIANHEGLGIGELDKIDIKGKAIADVREAFIMPVTYSKPYDRYVLGMFENVDIYISGACPECWNRARNIGKMLNAYGPENRFSLIIGTDPKIPDKMRTDLDNVVVFGDCALAATGKMKDLRNQMLLEEKGLLAPGCPAYRPAAKLVETFLIKKGLLDPQKKVVNAAATKKRTYEYYKKIDPTWVPKSEM